jgi:hypothetical protein
VDDLGAGRVRAAVAVEVPADVGRATPLSVTSSTVVGADGSQPKLTVYCAMATSRRD